ncbi:MAG: hypothetical protein LWW93_09760 [Hyphomicrobiales bacterium]|nr:hypothetical protein [Hyphomicrobiales bacterium]
MTAVSAAVLAFALLTGCSSVDTVVYTPHAATVEPAAKSPLVHAPSEIAAAPIAATGVDGYPNVNVDTARRLPGTARSSADQDKLEAELLALGARQRAGTDGSAPSSVIGELQELGRRSKRDAETLIESGAAPTQ